MIHDDIIRETCRTNLEQGFRLLVEKFKSPMYWHIRRMVVSHEDAEDVLQEVYLTAYQKFQQLKNKDSFKAWILSIARNKCNDYFREKAIQYEIPLEEVAEDDLADSRYGVSVISTVRETLNSLADKDKKILYLYFDIKEKLGL